MSICLSDNERKGASVSEPPAQRRGVLGSQWDSRDAFSVEEAGKILGLSRASAFAAANRGDIPVIRIGKRLIVPRRALERLLGATEADAHVGGQQAPQIVAAPAAPTPQRVELAIHVLPPERRPPRSFEEAHRPAGADRRRAGRPAPPARACGIAVRRTDP
jgi:hypothetical protein